MSDNPGAEILASSLFLHNTQSHTNAHETLEDAVMSQCDIILSKLKSNDFNSNEAVQALDLLKDATPDSRLQDQLSAVIIQLQDNQPIDDVITNSTTHMPSTSTPSVTSSISFDAEPLK